MNSNFSKKIGTGVIVFVIMVCFTPSLAGAFTPDYQRQDKGFDRQDHNQPALGIWRNPQMVQKLKLTKEQVKQLRDADFTFREKCLELKAQLDAFRLQMDKAFSDDIVDNAAVIQLAKKISDIKGKIFIQDIESRLAVGKILNGDQIKKLRPDDMHQKKQDSGHGKKAIPGPHGMEMPDDKKVF
ncbi:Spy/CpxP family protein refolding chaperone [Desulfobacula phenolica]|uniref:LTXXQ motif family protein n=1 Tax=Desulfobacula phenolica TaxID=90732 RepID=A0A1H2IQ55_9BACT|nr:hypothetical protein [Desulfobacula phenolica]SDU46233.1 hypothetical protein SAMN04487931_10980 [Desulfobacula phenolica]